MTKLAVNVTTFNCRRIKNINVTFLYMYIIMVEGLDIYLCMWTPTRCRKGSLSQKAAIAKGRCRKNSQQAAVAKGHYRKN